MRIAMFFSSDPSKAGGVQEHVFFLSRELRTLGHEVTLFGPRANALPFENYVEVGDIRLVPIPNGNWANVHYVANSKDFFAQFDEKEYDICHIHEPYIPYFSWQVLQKIALPKVTSFHTGWNESSIINLINPFLPLFRDVFSTHIQGAIFISSLVQRRWELLCDERVEKKYIGYGIDHEMFYPIPLQPHKPVSLLFIARLVARKGLHYLLAALAEVKKAGHSFHLTVVGDGKQRLEIERLIRKLRLSEYVTLEGEVIGSAKVAYYQHADIFCVPYADEGLGLTILEAMACGCPIVGFWNEAFEEILSGYPGRNLMTAQRDVKGLTAALIDMIQHTEKRKTLRTWMISKSKKYEWSSVALQTFNLYERLLHTTGSYRNKKRIFLER